VSYSYLTRTAAALLGKAEQEVNLILCHLGGWFSATEVGGTRLSPRWVVVT